MLAFDSNVTIKIKESDDLSTVYNWNKAYKTYQKHLCSEMNQQKT